LFEITAKQISQRPDICGKIIGVIHQQSFSIGIVRIGVHLSVHRSIQQNHVPKKQRGHTTTVGLCGT
jgi:hypothetical protein